MIKTVTITIDREQAKSILAKELAKELDRPGEWKVKNIDFIVYNPEVSATFERLHEANEHDHDPETL